MKVKLKKGYSIVELYDDFVYEVDAETFLFGRWFYILKEVPEVLFLSERFEEV